MFSSRIWSKFFFSFVREASSGGSAVGVLSLRVICGQCTLHEKILFLVKQSTWQGFGQPQHLKHTGIISGSFLEPCCSCTWICNSDSQWPAESYYTSLYSYGNRLRVLFMYTLQMNTVQGSEGLRKSRDSRKLVHVFRQFMHFMKAFCQFKPCCFPNRELPLAVKTGWHGFQAKRRHIFA